MAVIGVIVNICYIAPRDGVRDGYGHGDVVTLYAQHARYGTLSRYTRTMLRNTEKSVIQEPRLCHKSTVGGRAGVAQRKCVGKWGCGEVVVGILVAGVAGCRCGRQAGRGGGQVGGYKGGGAGGMAGGGNGDRGRRAVVAGGWARQGKVAFCSIA